MQALTSSGNPVMASTRVLSSSGRTLDLSKLTVLTSSGSTVGKSMLGSTSASNVVMLTESPHVTATAGSSSVLVPLSSVTSTPITIVPRGTSSSKTVTECSSSVTPKINISSSTRTTVAQQIKANYTVSSGHLKRLETAAKSNDTSSSSFSSTTTTATNVTTTSKPCKLGKMIQFPFASSAGKGEEEDGLTPDKILELPIIFAKDDDSLFSGGRQEPEVLSTPIVVPINATRAEEGSSVVESTGDTISFPLDNLESELISHPTTSAQDIVLIKNASPREKLTSRRPVHQKTPRMLHNVGKLTPHTRHVQQGVKYTKIILSNRHPSLKVGRQEGDGKSGMSTLMTKIGSIDVDSSRSAKGSACDNGAEDIQL